MKGIIRLILFVSTSLLFSGQTVQAILPVIGWGYSYYQQAAPPNLENLVEIDGGFNHSIALKADGTVACWGLNNFGQCTPPLGLSEVSAVSAGYNHNLALLSNNTVVAWGNNDYGQCTIPATVSNAIGIAAGNLYSLAIVANTITGAQTVVGWGDNSQGQATPPANLNGVYAVSAGATHSMALRYDGTVVCWGNNAYGKATPPANLTGVSRISVGPNHSMALKDDQTVVCWGNNVFGQCTPPPGLLAVAISAGSFHSMAIRTDGSVVTWGYNGQGQTNTPPDLFAYRVAAGINHSLAIDWFGRLVGWGYDTNGQASPPVIAGTVAIAAGAYHTLVLKSDGTVDGWGENTYGQSTPPTNLTGVTAISAKAMTSLALKNDGTVVGWGLNTSGQASPPGTLTDAAAIDCGGNWSAALRSNGTVVGWGGGTAPYIPAGLNNVVAIGAGSTHGMALKNNGTVVCWGDNSQGQTNVPAGLGAVTAISAGAQYSLALKSDGTVAAWGYNGQGQTSVPTNLNDVVAISAAGFSMALKRDGTVVCWGDNTQGQQNIPAGLGRVVAIDAGTVHAMTLSSSRLVAFCTGSQIGLHWDLPNWIDFTQVNTCTVKRSTSPQGPFTDLGTVGGNVSDFTDTTASSGTTYYYAVVFSYTDPYTRTDYESPFSNLASTSLCPVPTVTVQAADPTAVENTRDPGAFAIWRTGGDLSQPLAVHYSVGGTATPTNDYPSLGTQVTIPANSMNVPVMVQPVVDGVTESPETVIMTLLTDANYTLGTPSQATVTIRDNPVGDASGTDFWLLYFFSTSSLTDNSLRLLVSGKQSTSGTVSIAGVTPPFTTNFSVTAGTVTVIPIPDDAMVFDYDTNQTKGVHITASLPVTVQAIEDRIYESEAYLGYPVPMLGTNYMLMSRPSLSDSHSYQSQFAVVATENNTSVTITPSFKAELLNHPTVTPFTRTLQQGETYQLRGKRGSSDITGTIVTADKPITVVSGAHSSFVPTGPVAAANPLIEQQLPVIAWGPWSPSFPLLNRPTGDAFRILAATDNTLVTLNGSRVALLQKGQFIETNILDPTEFRATQPIQVAQFSFSQNYAGTLGDPFETLTPSTSQYVTNHTFWTSPGQWGQFETNYVNIIAESSATSSVFLDGVSASSLGTFVPIGISGYSGVQIIVSNGSHTVISPKPVTVQAYGFADEDGYGYLGGMGRW